VIKKSHDNQLGGSLPEGKQYNGIVDVGDQVEGIVFQDPQLGDNSEASQAGPIIAENRTIPCIII